eukprot:SAG22_NODE_1113_length_5533_cov_5.884063_7_plen_83_part_00
MDFSNIQALLNFTAGLPATELTALAGFEFGNEIVSWTEAPPFCCAPRLFYLRQCLSVRFRSASWTLGSPRRGGRRTPTCWPP